MSKKALLWVVVVLLGVAALLAVTTPAPAVNKNIDSAELQQLQSAGARVVDVRTASEFATGHIPSSVNVPLDQLATASASWDKSLAIVVYCATGARSANAAAFLAGHGFTKVYNLAKGIASYTGAVVSGSDGGALPSGPGAVKTDGKPVFIDFASST